jgi:hypothetical protein
MKDERQTNQKLKCFEHKVMNMHKILKKIYNKHISNYLNPFTYKRYFKVRPRNMQKKSLNIILFKTLKCC